MTNTRYIARTIQSKLVYEHRYNWEQANQACLLAWSDIHHLNGIKTDNRPENLDAMMKYQHTLHHLVERRKNEIDQRICPLCKQGTYHRIKRIRKYVYSSAVWERNPLDKSQRICRKCFRMIMKTQFGRRL